MNLTEEVGIVLAALEAFASGCHQMVAVKALDELSLCLDPFCKASLRHRVAGKSTRLVSEFPCHDGRRFAVRLACNGVGARHDIANMTLCHCLCAVVLDELAMIVLCDGPVRPVGHRAATCPFEVSAIAPTPFPSIVQEEDSRHLALLEFCQKVVQALKNSVVIDARLGLENWHNVRSHCVRAFATNEDTHIGDAYFLHQVEFLLQSFTVAALTFACQDCTVPEVCTDELVLIVAAIELAITGCHESAAVLLTANAADIEQQHSDCC